MKYHIERWDRDEAEWRMVATFADPRDLISFLHTYIGWRNCAVYLDGALVANGRQYSMSVSRSVFTSHVKDLVIETAPTA